MKNKICLVKIIVTICAIVILILLSVPIPIKMDKNIEAVEYSISDIYYEKKVNVHIKGTYHLNLVKKDTFRGNISIDIYPFTIENSLIAKSNDYNISFDGYEQSLAYGSLDNYKYLGSITNTTFLKDFVIKVFDNNEGKFDSWSHIDGKFIVTKGISREEAIEKLGI